MSDKIIKQVGVNDLVTEGLQTRFTLNEGTIAEYAEAMRENGPATFPPITVFEDPSCKLFYLADGFHRVAAARANGYETIAADVTTGSFVQALTFALSANGAHGLRRTNADKRQALEMAWENRFSLFPACDDGEGKKLPCGQPSSRQLAEICGVSQRNSSDFLKNKEGVSKLLTPLPEDDAAVVETDCVEDPADVTEAPQAKKSPAALLKEGKDRFGMVIPEKLMPMFTETLLIDAVRTIGQVRAVLNKAYREGQPAACHISNFDIHEIDKVIYSLKFARPYCVCRACRGERCPACSNTGTQTKHQYEMLPHELKDPSDM